jgi:glycosyltransferase involved in cell wall biosynthesis
VLAPALEMKKKGAKLIYEIDDDLFNIPEWNPAAKTLNVKKVQDGIKYFVSNVDAIFVTTEELRGIYRNYCENIYVLPNSVDSEIIYPCNRNTVKPVVCWQGSTTHERDLMVARAGFEQLAKDQDIIFKLWCGYDGKTREPAFNIPGAETLQLVPFEAFYQMFSQVGTYVGLAPLCANVFNKSKSNLKFLEYTVHDAVTVASNFGPYKDTIEDGVTGILVSDNSEWYEKVRMVLADQDMHKRILENAKRVVKENFSISTNYKLWDAAITDVLGRKDE